MSDERSGTRRKCADQCLSAPGPSFLLIIKYAPIYIRVKQPFPQEYGVGGWGVEVKELTTVVSELLPAFTPSNLFRMSVVKRTNDHNLSGNVVVVKVRDRMYTMSGGLRGTLEYRNRAIRYPGGGNIMLITLTSLWNAVFYRHTPAKAPSRRAELKACKPQAQLLN